MLQRTWALIYSFFKQDSIWPFLLMVHAMVLLFSLVALKTMQGYIFVWGYIVFSIVLYSVCKSRHHDSIQKVYTLLWWVSIVLWLSLQIATSLGYFTLPGRWNSMIITLIILIICYIIAHLYLHLVSNFHQDSFHKKRLTKDIFYLWCTSILLWVFYFLDILSLLSCLWFISIMVIFIKKRDYRLMVLAALCCLLITIWFSLMHNEEFGNIAASYSYFYLCATVTTVLFTKDNQVWNL